MRQWLAVAGSVGPQRCHARNLKRTDKASAKHKPYAVVVVSTVATFMVWSGLVWCMPVEEPLAAEASEARWSSNPRSARGSGWLRMLTQQPTFYTHTRLLYDTGCRAIDRPRAQRPYRHGGAPPAATRPQARRHRSEC